MAYEEIVLQLVLISFILVMISQILNKLLGMSPGNMKEIRNRATNLQKRIANVKAMGDYAMMQELQMETMQLMKSVIKKQLVPMCVRCIIFLGIWIFVGILYADYGTGSDFFFGLGWFWLYFLLALGWSLSIYGLRKLIRKKTGKDNDKRTFAREIMEMLNPQTGVSTQGGLFQPGIIPQAQQIPPISEPSWKDRIHDSGIKAVSWKEKITPINPESSQKLIESESSRFCPKCGSKVSIKDIFCKLCQADLNE